MIMDIFGDHNHSDDKEYIVKCNLILFIFQKTQFKLANFAQKLVFKLLTTNSLFSRNVWSRNFDLETKTNNDLEGLHAKLNRGAIKSNPAYREVVDTLKKTMIV